MKNSYSIFIAAGLIILTTSVTLSISEEQPKVTSTADATSSSLEALAETEPIFDLSDEIRTLNGRNIGKTLFISNPEVAPNKFSIKEILVSSDYGNFKVDPKKSVLLIDFSELGVPINSEMTITIKYSMEVKPKLLNPQDFDLE